MEGVSKSEVSRICAELDAEVEAFRNRPPAAAYPYLWLDATYLKVRESRRLQGMALVVAVGVRETGEREVLGLNLGPAEDALYSARLIAPGLNCGESSKAWNRSSHGPHS